MLSNEYLTKVAQLLKMTSHFETQLEEQRIKLSITPHFQARTIYNLLITNTKGIMRCDIINLFRNFMQNINERELDCLFQLYSSDNSYINWDDFYQLICPYDMFLDTKIHDNINEQIISDILQQLQRLFKIEVMYFKQAEPIRMILFEKYKENGKQFCTLLEDKQKFISTQNLINFMNKQKFQYNNQDIFCLKKRIKSSEENIPSELFIKYCPLLPFKVMISKSPDYRLITIRQPTPEIIKSAELLKSKPIEQQVLPDIPQINIVPAPSQEEETFQQVASVPQFKQLKKAEISNYEFYTGKKPDATLTQSNFKQNKPENQNFKNQNDYDFKLTKSESHNFFGFKQSIPKDFGNTQRPEISKDNDQILDKYLRPSASRKGELPKQLFNKEHNNYQIQKNKSEDFQVIENKNKIGQIQETQNKPTDDILNEHLHPIKQQKDQFFDSGALTHTRKYKIFDDIPNNQLQLQSNMLFDSKSKIIDSAFDSGNLNSQQIQKKSKKYVTASMSQEEKLPQY
ncbi:unnamed protein product [Paramecium primaurelia]|uniref:Uncharacterized protein n=1 Tax=Paramecium primaurelia TaxID=5886 RepID=A0A8S1KCB0_PARPR|nr:unnamed protein product [Paramecium primaurelia]